MVPQPTVRGRRSAKNVPELTDRRTQDFVKHPSIVTDTSDTASDVEHAGETFAWGAVSTFRVADGRIAECWMVLHDQDAFDEIWSSADSRSRKRFIGYLSICGM